MVNNGVMVSKCVLYVNRKEGKVRKTARWVRGAGSLTTKSTVNAIIEAILQVLIEKFIYDDIDIARDRFDNKGIFPLGVIPANFSFGRSFGKVR